MKIFYQVLIMDREGSCTVSNDLYESEDEARRLIATSDSHKFIRVLYDRPIEVPEEAR